MAPFRLILSWRIPIPLCLLLVYLISFGFGYLINKQ